MTTNVSLLRSVAVSVLQDHGGVAHLQQFLARGLTRENVAHLRHIGVLERPRIGWYMQPGLPKSATEAVRVGGVAGCVSAAVSWGLPVPSGIRHTHVSLTRDTTRLRRSNNAAIRARAGTDSRVRWHWEHRAQPIRGWRVSPVDALLQSASCVSFDWLVAGIDAARRRRTEGQPLSAEELELLRGHLPQRLRHAVDLSDPRAESSGETMIRLGVQRADIPFDLQVWLTSRYRTDLLVDGWLPVESDGLRFHASEEAVAHDRERDAILANFGARPLRFLQRQAVDELPFVIATIERVWRAGPRF